MGNKLLYKGSFGCFKSPTEIVKGADFEEKVNCEYFVPDIMHTPRNETEEMIAFLSRQIDEVIDLLGDVLEIINPTQNDDNAQKCAEDNNNDE